MTESTEVGLKPASEEEVREALYDVVDPELGIDVVNLGLGQKFWQWPRKPGHIELACRIVCAHALLRPEEVTFGDGPARSASRPTPRSERLRRRPGGRPRPARTVVRVQQRAGMVRARRVARRPTSGRRLGFALELGNSSSP